MASETVLSGRELDRAIAEASGWKLCDAQDCRWSWTPSDPHTHDGPPDYGSAQHIPMYHASVDALIAGPEARLRAAGWWLRVDVTLNDTVNAYWFPPQFATAGTVQYQPAHAPTEAKARARAALQALRVLQREVV